MIIGTTVFNPWVGNEFQGVAYDRLNSYIFKGVVTGIEQDGKDVVRQGDRLLIAKPSEWFDTEVAAKRRVVEILLDRWEALRKQIDTATAELRGIEG